MDVWLINFWIAIDVWEHVNVKLSYAYTGNFHCSSVFHIPKRKIHNAWEMSWIDTEPCRFTRYMHEPIYIYIYITFSLDSRGLIDPSFNYVEQINNRMNLATTLIKIIYFRAIFAYRGSMYYCSCFRIEKDLIMHIDSISFLKLSVYLYLASTTSCLFYFLSYQIN